MIKFLLVYPSFHKEIVEIPIDKKDQFMRNLPAGTVIIKIN